MRKTGIRKIEETGWKKKVKPPQRYTFVFFAGRSAKKMSDLAALYGACRMSLCKGAQLSKFCADPVQIMHQEL